MKPFTDLYRTDLAIEEKESHDESSGKLPGIRVHERLERNTKIEVSVVTVENAEGAAAIGKPVGTYLTLSGGSILGHTDEEIQATALVMGKALNRLLPRKWSSMLVIGLGNADMTADALGPGVTEKLLVNRHLEHTGKKRLSALTPGVMGQTGIETLEIVKGVLSEVHPDVLVVIDALAARSTSRLLSTIQLSDTGICPGSGVGNYRMELSRETLGLPVIAIGIPTVIGATTIVCDTLEAILDEEELPASLTGRLPDLLAPIRSMHVTPKDIDVSIKELSTLLAEGIHQVIYGD